MLAPVPLAEIAPPTIASQPICDWAKAHYRDRCFAKDEPIPARPGLLYLVERGAIRLMGMTQTPAPGSRPLSPAEQSEAVLLGFVRAGLPFEFVARSPFHFDAYAHVDGTQVIWLYWPDLELWPEIQQSIWAAFRYQHQRKLLWLSTLGQRRTIDRLVGILTLLMEECGEPWQGGYRLPFPLTHAHLGSAIGSTRVTVTRLMGRLRERGVIVISDDNLIGMP
ncbi:MAG: Crp/Fnr family transcriptional regulator [Spirulina sp. DLM2.Bin59]|nr:MAG: Crp/Fnr family transcriptional regulator [Spirulina sp. DLM2.Bin59]